MNTPIDGKLITPMLDRFTQLLAVVAGFFMVLIAVHITADVFMKLAFKMPIEGTTELVSFWYMVGVMFLPMAVAQRQNSHIVADVLTPFLSPRRMRFLDAAAQFLMVAYIGLLTWQSGLQAYEETLRSEQVQAADFYLAVYPTRWFVPLGFGVTAVYAALQGFRALYQKD
ncbi:MAG: TRAP transporter small permease [Betaproteobacteria bacterium]